MGDKNSKNSDIINKKAVVLKYDIKDIAPKVLAKGQGFLAERLLEQGKESNIPVYKDEKLVEALTKIDVGDNIPPELYEVVAHVLTFISDLDKLQEKING
jgi:flagellar biosynthesis protein